MKDYTRTQYSAKNTYIATVSRIAAILMGFVTRVVFTHTLSESYVGVNGLFMDILNVLSLSELGIETAITYALYRPIADNNKEEQKSIMRIYCWYYRAVSAFVILAGLALIPFMGIIMKNRPDVSHLTVIYLLYVLNSGFSYLLIYKKTLIDAHQMAYIGILYQTGSWMIQDILQIIILIYTKNFILFLIIYLCCTLGSNICISRRADKLYPYLKDKNVKPLEKQKKQAIFKNVSAMFMHKIGSVVLNNTDNLILSSFIGIVSVGCYSNYFLIIKSIDQILNQMFKGITASIGNLGVTEKTHRVKRVYETTFFIAQWVYGFAVICLYELINPFVKLSFGKNYLFTKDIVLILCINFFFIGMKVSTLVFRDSLGLFWFDRYISLTEAGINLIVSILLVRQFGTIGVFLGTMISMILTSVWLEPYLVYKNYLKTSCKSYFIHYLWYVVSIGCIWWLADFLCHMVTGGYFMVFIKKLLICILVPNIIMTVLYFKTKEFKYVIEKVYSMRNSRKSNRVKEKLSSEQLYLFDLLKRALMKNKQENQPSRQKLTEIQWNAVFQMAKNHAVLPLLYDSLEQEENLPKDLIQNVQNISRQIVQQNYKLLYVTNYIVKLFEREAISVMVLKGVSTASFYPVPELRKSGDIDLLVAKKDDFKKASSIMEENNFAIIEKQQANHHVIFQSKDGIMIEIHTMLAVPFDNQRINNYLNNLSIEYHSHIEERDILGSRLPVPQDAYHAFYLLLHILQHFLRSGFGLKLLCDWVVFWNRDIKEEEKDKFLQLVSECGLYHFFIRITAVCIEYLGLEEAKVDFANAELLRKEEPRKFMLEIMEAEEFGKSANDRMVILRGTSPIDYMREFHHQMSLSYPKACKIVLIWPVLWLLTLIRFLFNNRKIRKVSLWAVLKKTKARSKSIKELDLFKMK